MVRLGEFGGYWCGLRGLPGLRLPLFILNRKVVPHTRAAKRQQEFDFLRCPSCNVVISLSEVSLGWSHDCRFSVSPDTNLARVYHNLEVSINGCTQKCLMDNRISYFKMDDLGVPGVRILRTLHLVP